MYEVHIVRRGVYVHLVRRGVYVHVVRRGVYVYVVRRGVYVHVVRRGVYVHLLIEWVGRNNRINGRLIQEVVEWLNEMINYLKRLLIAQDGYAK